MSAATTVLRSLRAGVRLSMARWRAMPGPLVVLVLTMAGLAVVWAAVPLYAEAASSRLLSEQVDEADADGVPFGYLVSYNRLSGGNRAWADLTPLSDYLSAGSGAFGAEVASAQRLAETVPFDVYAEGAAPGDRDGAPVLDRLAFVALSELDGLVDFVDGRSPRGDAADGIEVAVSADLADVLGVSVGDALVAVDRRGAGSGEWSTRVRVSGLWTQPDFADRSPAGRLTRSPAARNGLVIAEQALAQTLAPVRTDLITEAQWLVLLDSAAVRTEDVTQLLARTDGINRAVDDRLTGSRVLVNPGSSLEAFRGDVERRESGLRSFAIPTLSLLLVAVAAAVAMVWQRRSRELTVLRRRGAPLRPLVAGSVVEAGVLAALATVLGGFGATAVAAVIARSETFLRFGEGAGLDLAHNRRSLRALAVVGLVLFLIQLLPLTRLAGWGLRSQRRRESETRHEALWFQRTGLDLVAVLVVAVVTAVLLRAPTRGGDLLSTPVVILLPTAIAIAVALLVARLFPAAMGGVARVAERSDRTAPVLAARRAARVRGARTAPLVLLVVTGALAIFTASLARTLDLQLVDSIHHRVGAANSIAADEPSGAVEAAFARRGLGWGPPVDPSSFERVWGLENLARIAELNGRATRSGGEVTSVDILAVDPQRFAAVAFWRDDYAQRPLAELMATMGANADGVLASSALLRSQQLRVGDRIELDVTDGRTGVSIPATIVGSFDQFPGRTGGGSPPVVVDLADLEQRLGRPATQRVIFDETPAVAGDDGQTRADLNRLGVSSRQVERADEAVERALLVPERQGVFGLLTLGFGVATALTMAAFGSYAALEHRSQRREHGVLRALGLGERALFAVVGFDLLFVVLGGLLAATATGVAMAIWLLPRLLEGAVDPTPALLVEVDWAAVGAIVLGVAVVFVAAYVVLLVALRRIRLFEAVKLGATDD